MSYSIPTEFPTRPFQNTQTDKQAIFSAVWDYFITGQRERCMKQDGQSHWCLYRDGDHACAIGMFIPTCEETALLLKRANDSQATVAVLFSLETGVGIPRDIAQSLTRMICRVFDVDLQPFLADLQRQHDEGICLPLERRLTEFAARYHLTIPS